MKNENDYLKNALELLIFGDQFFPNSRCYKINDLLQVELAVNDLNNTHKLGEKEDSPIKIELISYLKKKYEREHYKILQKHLLLAR